MDVIYTLIPGMLMFGLILVGVLIWAVKKGQYEDFEGDGQRILMDEDATANKGTSESNRTVRIGKNFPDAED